MVQFEHHAAALRAVLGEVLDAQRLASVPSYLAQPSPETFSRAGGGVR